MSKKNNSFSFLLSALLIALLIPSWILAQEVPKKTASESFKKFKQILDVAEVAEKSEQNLKKAEKINQQVTGSRNVPNELLSRAFWQLGTVLKAQGKKQEALVAFKRAAEIEGPFAKRAKAFLTQQTEADRKLTRHIEKLIIELKNQGNSADPIIEKLTPFGNNSLERLSEELEKGEDHEILSRMARALILIGSEDARKILEKRVDSKDRFIQQIILQQINYSSTTSSIRRCLIPLVEKSPFPTNREAMEKVVKVLTAKEISEYISSDDWNIQRHALHEVDSRKLIKFPEVAKALYEYITDGYKPAQNPSRDSYIKAIINSKYVNATDFGHKLLIEAVILGIIDDTRSADYLNSNYPYSLPPQVILDTVERIKKIKDSSKAEQARHVLEQITSRALYEWKPKDLDTILKLVRIYFSHGGLESIALNMFNSDDAHLLSKELGHFKNEFYQALNLLQSYGVTDEIIKEFITWIDQLEFRDRLHDALSNVGRNNLRSRVSPSRTTSRSSSSRRSSPTTASTNILTTIAKHNSSLTEEFLLKLHRLDANRFGEYIRKASTDDYQQNHSKIWIEILKKGTSNSEGAFSLLYRLSNEGVFDPVIPQIVSSWGPSRFPSYFQILFFGSDNYNKTKHTLPERIKILEAAFSGDASLTWLNHLRELTRSQLSTKNDSAEKEILKLTFKYALHKATPRDHGVFIQHLFNLTGDCEDLKVDLRNRIMESKDVRLIQLAAYYAPIHPAPEKWLQPLLVHNDAEIVNAALQRMNEVKGDDKTSWVLPCLKNKSHQVRRQAVSVLYNLGGEKVVKDVIQMTKDPNEMVRREACNTLGRSLLPEAADALIESLRDSSSHVSGAASGALSRIEKYFEHRKRWDNWSKEYTLESENAAEALLKLTSKDNPQVVRLAAVDSLAAIAMPETLPYLIRLMLDEDKKVANKAEETLSIIRMKLLESPTPQKKE